MDTHSALRPHRPATPVHASAPPLGPPQVLRCRSTADFLAALPILTGFTADDSLFIVLFTGSRSQRALRVDLPPHDAAHALPSFADAVAELLGRHAGNADAVAFVFMSARSFAETGGVPCLSLARTFRRGMARSPLHLRELAVVASDGWIGLLDPRHGGRPRPLAEISASPVFTAVAPRATPPVTLADLGALPHAEARRTAAVCARLAELDARPDPAATEPPEALGDANAAEPHRAPPWVYGVARVADACFTGSEIPDARLAARLIRAAEHPGSWLVLVLGTFSRADALIRLAETSPPDRFIEASIDIDDGAEPNPEHDWSIRRFLSALAADQPDDAQLKGAIEAVAEITAHAPVGRRPGLLALLAWAWWMLGMGSVADRCARAALEIAPHHELASMVSRLVAHPPSWVFDRAIEADPPSTPRADRAEVTPGSRP